MKQSSPARSQIIVVLKRAMNNISQGFVVRRFKIAICGGINSFDKVSKFLLIFELILCLHSSVWALIALSIVNYCPINIHMEMRSEDGSERL